MKWVILLIIATALVSGCLQSQAKCGVEQCHGLNITCGPNVPEFCTEIYMLGDFCRQYFPGCKIVNGICQSAGFSTKFDECKACVEECKAFSDPMMAFDCESTCRSRMELYCESDEDCSCGVKKETGECFYGNSNFVDTSRQCPDFCTGIGGNLIIKCMDRHCKQIAGP